MKKINRVRNLLKRQNGKCHYCGKPLLVEQATIDHKTPVARGGTNHSHNMAAACSPCNGEKAMLTEGEYRKLRGDPRELTKAIGVMTKNLQAAAEEARAGKDWAARFFAEDDVEK